MSNNDWPKHQEQLCRMQQQREALNRAVSIIDEEKRVSRQLAIRLLVDLARVRHRVVWGVAADVVRIGRLPEV